MSFLAPWALLAALSIPALVWLWRFAATRHRTVVPSLAPFAHLLKRAPSRRTRLIVNVLFWLQVAALAALTLTLAEPVRVGRRLHSTLVLVDTSASMQAGSAWARATQDAASWLAQRGPDEQVLVMQTAPPAALTQGDAFDAAQVGGAVRALETSDLSGNLAVARRIGRALLGRQPDATVVFTDEPKPPLLEPGVEFHSYADALPNAAVVGLDASESLCLPADAQLVVTVQNFSAQAQDAAVLLQFNGRQIARQAVTLAPGAAAPVSFAVPEQAGVVEVRLSAAHDALASDNQAWAIMRGEQPFPVTVSSTRPAFVTAVGQWLDACPRAQWTSVSTPGAPPAPGATLVTDDPSAAAAWPASVVLFARQPDGQPSVVAQSLPAAPHPVGEYVQPLEAIPGVVPSAASGAWGDPVLWGVANGRKLPLVRAASSGGRRIVSLMTDPAASGSSVASVVLFFNSLRWLSGLSAGSLAGEPLAVGPFTAGTVVIQPPRGPSEHRAHAGGWLAYDATEHAGRYRFSQGRLVLERAVNAMDPVESNTFSRASTWAPEKPEAAGALLARPMHSLASWLLTLLLIAMLAEWALYIRPRR